MKKWNESMKCDAEAFWNGWSITNVWIDFPRWIGFPTSGGANERYAKSGTRPYPHPTTYVHHKVYVLLALYVHQKRVQYKKCNNSTSNNADKWHIRLSLIFFENRSETPYTRLTWMTVTRNTHHNMFYLHILVTTYLDVKWCKNLQKEWKNDCSLFPRMWKSEQPFHKKLH